MEKMWLHGELADISFSPLLFHIWKAEKSGRLHLKKSSDEKILDFFEGIVVLTKSSLSEKDFLKDLIRTKYLSPDQASQSEAHAAQKRCSLLKALMELYIFPPAQLWKHIELFFKSQYFPVFDWAKAEYYFDTAYIPPESDILLSIDSPEFILQGVRQMENFILIQSHLPSEDKQIQLLLAEHDKQPKLEPPEKYLLQIIKKHKKLKEVYSLSELGKKESRKIIYGFLSAGIVGLFKQSGKSPSTQDFSQAEIRRISENFHAKCVYIFKYLSKEAGPVAANVLEKCLEDIKPYLPSSFQNISLGPDGRVEVFLPLKTSFLFDDIGFKQIFLRGLNEILAAEVLAVKKTLGNGHESSLVKNLDKICE